MSDLFIQFLSDPQNIAYGIPFSLGIRALYDGLKAGVSAIHSLAKGDPVRNLEKEAINIAAAGLEADKKDTFILIAEEFIKTERLIATEKWCSRLRLANFENELALRLQKQSLQAFIHLARDVARKNRDVFQVAVLEELQNQGVKQDISSSMLTELQSFLDDFREENKRDHDEIKQLFENSSRASNKAIPSIYQLPPPPKDFTGREEELKELLGKLKDGGVSISGLRGMGGIGKTALALVLAAKLAPDYPDGQFYLDLKGTKDKGAKPLTPAEAMSHVIRGYYPDSKLPEDEAQLKGLYNSVLHGKRALLLMDNALDAGQVTPLIPPDGNVLLITSRQHFHLSGIFPKDLNTLRPADAKELLLKIARNIGTAADEIAQLCGYLPFALLNAGGALVDQHIITPAEYAERLTEAKTRLELVEASLSLSYDLLDAEMQKLWRTLAVFPDSFDSAAAAAVWSIPQEKAEEKLNILVNRSLVDCDETTNRCRLHDLGRVFADSRLTDKDERYAAQKRHAGHYVNVLIAANYLYLQGGKAMMNGLALFDLEWINIRAGQAWATQNAPTDETAARLCSRYSGAGSLLPLRLHPRDCICWLESALSAACRLKDRVEECVHLGNLGLAYAALGETRRPIEHYEQAISIAREIGDRRGEGAVLGNLGITYAALGETRRAIDYHEKALKIDCEIGNRAGEGNALNNLGLAYAALGESRRSIGFYEKAIEIHREIGDRRGEGQDLGNLGLAYADLGETRRAIEFYEQYLSIAGELGDRRGEGNALGSLGAAYADLGETRRAIAFSEQYLAITRETGDRRGEGTALGSLGNAYLLLGETRRAIEFYERYLSIAGEIGDRRGEGAVLCNLGLAYAALGETRRAIEYYEQNLPIAREIGDRRGEGNALGNLGLAYAALGETCRAIQFYEQQLTIVREIGDRRREGNALGNLGLVNADLGEPRRAIEYYEQQLVMARGIGDRRGEGNALWNMSLALDKLGEHKEAIAKAEAALVIYEQIEDPAAAKARAWLQGKRGK